jgi:hypothetical protein
MTPDPATLLATAAHIDAVAQRLYVAHPASASVPWESRDGFERAPFRTQARRLLTASNPDAQAALAANLPSNVMLARFTDDELAAELTVRRMARVRADNSREVTP